MYVIISCVSHLTVDYASFSREGTVPTPDRDPFNVSGLSTFCAVYYIVKGWEKQKKGELGNAD